VVRVTKVATGPMTEEEATGIGRFGDLASCAPAIQKLAASRGVALVRYTSGHPVIMLRGEASR
jgi:hypothetical protein